MIRLKEDEKMTENYNENDANAQAAANVNENVSYTQNTTTSVEEFFDPADIEKNKTIAGLAYLLFFLPLISCPDSRYGKFHANQGLLLLIFGIGGGFILGLIPIIGTILAIFYPIVVMVFGIIGLVNGFQGKAKRLPLIGKINIIKH